MSGLNAEDERAGQQAAGAIREATNYHSDEVTDASRSTKEFNKISETFHGPEQGKSLNFAKAAGVGVSSRAETGDR